MTKWEKVVNHLTNICVSLCSVVQELCVLIYSVFIRILLSID